MADKLPGVFSRFEAVDIYNASETARFYQMLPGRTLALKGHDCHGGKQSKLRVTVLLCANTDGTDKWVSLVVGNSAHPRRGRSECPP